MTYLPFVTIFSGLVLYTLRARVTQYGFTNLLGRCVLLYFMNHMGHA